MGIFKRFGEAIKGKFKRHRKLTIGGLSILLALGLLFSGVQFGILPIGSTQHGQVLTIGQHQLVLTIGTAEAATTPDYTCDGTDDDVQWQAAVTALPSAGGTLEVLGGLYRFSNAVTNGGKVVTIRGQGKQITQVLQTVADKNAFAFSSIDGMYLGGMAIDTVAGVGNCVVLTNVHHSTFENIHSPGAGVYAWYIKGCILNTFINVDVTGNYGPVSGGATTFNTGFYLEPYGGIHCNANTFVGCVLEGGQYGYYETSSLQGGNLISGGVMEGQAVYAIYADSVLGLQVIGTHFEIKGIYLSSCVDSIIEPLCCPSLKLVGCRNITFGGGIGVLTIDNTSKWCRGYGLGITTITNYSLSSDVFMTREAAGESLNRGLGLYSRGYLINSNADTENWTAGVPTGFFSWNSANITQTGTGQADTTTLNRDYSCKMTKTAADTTQGLGYNVPARFKGQWISVEFLSKWISGAPAVIAYFDAGAAAVGLWELPSSATNTAKNQGYIWWNPIYGSLTIYIYGPNLQAAGFYVDSIRFWAEYDPVN